MVNGQDWNTADNVFFVTLHLFVPIKKSKIYSKVIQVKGKHLNQLAKLIQIMQLHLCKLHNLHKSGNLSIVTTGTSHPTDISPHLELGITIKFAPNP